MLKGILSLAFGFSLMVVLLITAARTGIYQDPSFYEREYVKYSVSKDTGAKVEDLMTVTRAMLSYLEGKRDTLEDVEIPVRGRLTPFFNTRELVHLKDVEGIFRRVLELQKYLLIFMLLVFFLALWCRLSPEQFLSRSILWGGAVFLLVLALGVLCISRDFNRYFILMHQLVFTNDYWILDPARDNLINMLPSELFQDLARRIALIYGLLLTASQLLAALLWHRSSKTKAFSVK